MRLHILISTNSSRSSGASNSWLSRGARRGWRRRCQHVLQLVYVGAAAAHVGPHLLLDALAKHDVETRLVFGPDDYTHFLTQRGADAINRIRARDADLSVVVTTKGDHPALHWRVREAAVESVLEALGVRQSITSDARPRIQRRIRRSSSLR